MIYTVTLNPSIDYYMTFADVKSGAVNRSTNEYISFGGKGINVSRMLKQLGCDSCAVAMVGGDNGRLFLSGLESEDLNIKPIYAAGNTRINVKLADGTELNGAGPMANEIAIKKLNGILQKAENGDIVVFSGSICRGFSLDVYDELITALNKKGIYIVVDAAGKVLNKVIQKGLFLIKPNIHELSDLFDTDIKTKEEASHYALRLTDMGIENVLVSLGENGALLASDKEVFFCDAPKVNAVNSICAGDCTLAGYLYAYLKGFDKLNSLAYAVACGTSKVTCKNTFPSKDLVEDLYNEISKI